MNNELKVFTHELFGKIRVIEVEGEPKFNLFDTGFALGYTRENGKGVLYLRKDKLNNICETLGIKGVSPSVTNILIDKNVDYENTYVHEEDLYDLILESKAKNARLFRKWITSDVVPSIRKHGAYMTPETIEKVLLNPDTIIQLATNLKIEQEKRMKLERKVEEQKPLVTFAEKCLKTNDSILIREFSKVIQEQGIHGYGEKNLYKKLREWGLILQGKTEPSQRAMEMELFEVIQRPKLTPYGEILTRTTKVLPKGQVYIMEKIMKEIKNKVS